MANVIEIILKSVDQMSEDLKNVQGALKAMGDQSGKTSEETDKVGKSSEESGKAIEGFNTAMTALGAVTGQVNQRLEFLGKAVEGLGRGVPLIAVAGFAAALLHLARETADAGAELKKTADINGISVETFSALKVAAEQNDSSLGELSIGLRTLNRELASAVTQGGEAQKKFIELGLTNEQLTQFYTDNEAALEAVAKKITETGSATERTRLAISFFGRAGRELLPLLKEIATKGLEGVREEAEKAGLIMSTEAAAAAKKFNDNLTELSQTVEGFVQRSFGPFLEIINRFVADSPTVVKALGAITVAVLALGVALAALKLSQAIGLISTLKSVGAALLTPQGLVTAAIIGTGVALYGLSTASTAAKGTLAELDIQLAKNQARLKELQDAGGGASDEAKELQAQTKALNVELQSEEARLKALQDRLTQFKNAGQGASPDAKAVQAEIDKITTKPQAPKLSAADVLDKQISETQKNLDKLRNSGDGASDAANNLRLELDGLRKQLSEELQKEIDATSEKLEALEKAGRGAKSEANDLRVALEKLFKRKEKNDGGFKDLSDAAKQLQLDVSKTLAEVSKTVAQVGVQTANSMLEQGGDVNRFLDDIEKNLGDLRKASAVPIELQFKQETDTAGSNAASQAVVRAARDARLRLLDQQIQAQRQAASDKAGQAIVKQEEDRKAAVDTLGKSEEAFSSARIENEKALLELQAGELPVLDEVLKRAEAITASERARIQATIDRVQKERDAKAAELQQEQIAHPDELTPAQSTAFDQLRAQIADFDTEIAKAKGQLNTLGQFPKDLADKFKTLKIFPDLDRQVTEQETKLLEFNDQLSKLQLAVDLGQKVPFNEFLDVARKIDQANAEILAKAIERQAIELETLKILQNQQKTQTGYSTITDEQIKAQQAALDKLKVQATVTATTAEDKQLADLEKKIDDIAGTTAKNFVDRILDGLDGKKVDFSEFFKAQGKAILSDLLQESFKAGLKPLLREQAVLYGEKPADTAGGQLIQGIKFAASSLFGVKFDKRPDDPLEATRKALDKTTADQAQAAKEAAASVKDSGSTFYQRVIDAATQFAQKITQSQPKQPETPSGPAAVPGGGIADPNRVVSQGQVPAELAATERMIDEFLKSRDKREAEFQQSDNQDVKDTIAGQIATINTAISELGEHREELLKRLPQAQAAPQSDALAKTADATTTAFKSAATTTETSAKAASESIKSGASTAQNSFLESANVLNVAGQQLQAAAQQLLSCGCAGGSGGGGGTAPSLPIKLPAVQQGQPELQKSVDIQVDIPEDSLAKLRSSGPIPVSVDKPVQVEPAPNIREATITGQPQQQVATHPVPVVDVTPKPAESVTPIDNPLEDLVHAQDSLPERIAEAFRSAPNVASTDNSPSIGGGLLDALTAGAPNLALGASALFSKGPGGSLGTITQIQGIVKAAQGAVSVAQSLTKLFGIGGGGAFGFGSAPLDVAGPLFANGGFFSSAAGAAEAGTGGFFSSILGFLGFAKGGRIPESTRHTPFAKAMMAIPQIRMASGGEVPAFVTPGEYIMPVHAVRKIGLHNLDRMRHYEGGGLISNMSDAVPTSTMGKLGAGNMGGMASLEDANPKSHMGQRINGSTMHNSEPAPINQSIFLVDQRRPNLGPNDVELIIQDSIERGRGPAMAVKNVVKRNSRRN